MNVLDTLAVMTPSDWLLVLSIVPAAWFFVEYTLLTKWWPDPLGWVTALYNAAVLGLLGLIVYAIFVGERVPEVWRFIFALFLFTALWGKVIILHNERREGRLEKARLRAARQGVVMTEKTATDLVVPDIWYKGKRVLRTVVQTGIPSFLTFALVLPLIIEALGLPVESELRLWLVAVAAGVTAVAAAITRVMAIPAVNGWLVKIGLGSVPESALIEAKTVEDGKVVEITTVAPDPKAITPGVTLRRDLG